MKKISIIIILCISTVFCYSQITDELSLSSCFVLQVNSKNIPIKVASGFFIKVDSTTFFITNNHVISGEFAKQEHFRDTKKPIPVDSTTNYIRIRTYGDKLNTGFLFNLYLFNGKDSASILMWEDPINKKGLMDVIAIPLADSLKKYLGVTKILTPSNILPDLKISPSSELFIVGFPAPYGQNEREFYPIWKKGTIASEPDLGEVYYWVDALTMGGMSGSPVFYRNQYYQTKSGNSIMQVGGTPTFLLGIYSAQNYGLNLGKVWKLDKVVEQLKSYRPK